MTKGDADKARHSVRPGPISKRSFHSLLGAVAAGLQPQQQYGISFPAARGRSSGGRGQRNLSAIRNAPLVSCLTLGATAPWHTQNDAMRNAFPFNPFWTHPNDDFSSHLPCVFPPRRPLFLARLYREEKARLRVRINNHHGSS